MKDVPLIRTIRSGGQSGADRGALDAARGAGIPVRGWCPAGGWAEDFPEPPGLREQYPELEETPSRETSQRTEWNVRDSDVTVIVTPEKNSDFGNGTPVSPGTALTVAVAERYGRPYVVTDGADFSVVTDWLRRQGSGLEVNIAGPRASEWADAYDVSHRLAGQMLGDSNAS